YSEKGPFFGYNMLSPVWTLTYEIFFYSLFALGLLVSQRYRKLVALCIIVLLFTGLQLMLNQRIEVSAYSDYTYPGITLIDPIIAVLSSPMILEFCFGIFLYIALVSMPDVSDRFRKIMNPFLIGLAALALVMFFSPIFYGHGPFKWGIPATVFLFAAMTYERYNGLPDSRALLYLGNISFSLYLVHVIILKIIRKYEFDFGLTGVWAFMFAVTLSLVAAAVAYRVIEYRSIRACRQLLKNINVPTPRPLAQA
ncbi:MAG TPA: acyltransferase, partial [Burkholderiaceae bacterium]|nr:acyltransferase [Burkholderiaceae bacterium]